MSMSNWTWTPKNIRF